MEDSRTKENHYVGFRVPADPLDSNTGVCAEITPSTYLHLTASLGSKL